VRERTSKTKRQLIEDARRAALDGRWEAALELNHSLIERSPKDAEAHNRYGRALVELRRFGPAIEAYSNALRSDPANMIARRNLQRLELLRHGAAADAPAEANGGGLVAPRTGVFIEEIGKTWVDELVNSAPMDSLVEVTPGQQLQLEVADGRIYITKPDGHRLGEIEARTAERLMTLIESGNRFEVYALGLTPQSLRVIVREIHRSAAQGAAFSFPRQLKTRAYLRERDLLRQKDEADFFMLDDEDDEEDEEPPTEPADDDDTAEPEPSPFADNRVIIIEEEEAPI